MNKLKTIKGNISVASSLLNASGRFDNLLNDTRREIEPGSNPKTVYDTNGTNFILASATSTDMLE